MGYLLVFSIGFGGVYAGGSAIALMIAFLFPSKVKDVKRAKVSGAIGLVAGLTILAAAVLAAQ